jgi:hypothetical protein
MPEYMHPFPMINRGFHVSPHFTAAWTFCFWISVREFIKSTLNLRVASFKPNNHHVFTKIYKKSANNRMKGTGEHGRFIVPLHRHQSRPGECSATAGPLCGTLADWSDKKRNLKRRIKV